MPGIESFNRKQSRRTDDHVFLNARSIPVIDAGIANIKLGVFSVVCRRTTANWDDPRCGIALAFTVKCAIFGETSHPIDLGSLVDKADRVLASEIQATLADEAVRSAVALAFAAEIIGHAWRAGSANVSLRSSSDIVDRATNYGIEVPNIVEMWGPSAINNFFVASVEFMQRSVAVGNV